MKITQVEDPVVTAWKKGNVLLIAAMALLLAACEDVIDLNTSTGPTQLVVDGWITNQAGPQRIRLTESAAYFNNAPAPPVLGATVTVTDEKGRVYAFKDSLGTGEYVWNPAVKTDTLGHLNGVYQLSIKTGEEQYQATARLNRVPPIDSLTYYYDKPAFVANDSLKDGYVAQFFARDPTGLGDCYWIKTYRNGIYSSKANTISVAYDASFSPGSEADGLIFILPVRQSITTDLWQKGDVVKVELYAISQEAYYFLSAVRSESTNQGLFATPPYNIPTNVQNVNASGRKALGFFGGSMVSTFQTKIDPAQARPKP